MPSELEINFFFSDYNPVNVNFVITPCKLFEQVFHQIFGSGCAGADTDVVIRGDGQPVEFGGIVYQQSHLGAGLQGDATELA